MKKTIAACLLCLAVMIPLEYRIIMHNIKTEIYEAETVYANNEIIKGGYIIELSVLGEVNCYYTESIK